MSAISFLVITLCWLVFIGYWLASAFRVKAVAERQSWRASLKYKLPTILGGVLLWTRHAGEPPSWLATPQNSAWRVSGALLCVGGLAVAIWSRRTLAGNWSSNVTFKLGHELIQTGPYRYVRHPIYTGLLGMALGTAMAVGRLHSWLGFLFLFLGFWLKLQEEEMLLLRHFPAAYPAYRARVKALVPFLL